jgi:hypothetical protein
MLVLVLLTLAALGGFVLGFFGGRRYWTNSTAAYIIRRAREAVEARHER